MRIVKNGDVHVSAPFGVSKNVVMKFIEENRSWIEKAREKVMERQNDSARFYNQLPLTTREQRDEAGKRLVSIVKPMVERYSKQMNVTPSGVVIKRMTSRWGRCNVKTGEIAFSVYLLLLPEWCIEHVVVHELVHLLEANHSPRFYALMDKYFPRWREARAETRRVSRAPEATNNDDGDDL